MGSEWCRRGRILIESLVYLFGREGTVLATSTALSFFLSLFPIIVLLLSVPSATGIDQFRQAIFSALEGFFPISQEFIIRNLRIYTQGLGQQQLTSLLLTAWAGSTFFFSLEAGMDSAFRLPRPRRFLRSQVLGTAMAVMAGVLVFASVNLLDWYDGVKWPAAWQQTAHTAGTWAISYGLAFLLFLNVYYWLPSVRQPPTVILRTALFGSFIWFAADAIFRRLAVLWTLDVIYGPFYVSVTILLWSYLIACILLVSARLAADGFFVR